MILILDGKSVMNPAIRSMRSDRVRVYRHQLSFITLTVTGKPDLALPKL